MPSSANHSPLGAGSPPRQASEEEGAPQAQLLPDLATQYHHQMTVSAHFQLAGGRVNRGDRSGKSVYEREGEKREWVCYRGNRVRDSSGGARGNFTEVITAHCRGGVIAFFSRSMLKQVTKWTLDEPSDWNARFSNGLLESTVRRELCHSGKERRLGKKLMQRGKLPTVEMYC